MSIDNVFVGEHKSHLCVITLDERVHVIPFSLIRKIIEGTAPINALDEWEMIVRTVLSEWLSIVGVASIQYQ